jgi:hypothetical protein
MNWKSVEVKRSWPDLRSSPGISLGILRETAHTLNQDIGFPSQHEPRTSRIGNRSVGYLITPSGGMVITNGV